MGSDGVNGTGAVVAVTELAEQPDLFELGRRAANADGAGPSRVRDGGAGGGPGLSHPLCRLRDMGIEAVNRARTILTGADAAERSDRCGAGNGAAHSYTGASSPGGPSTAPAGTAGSVPAALDLLIDRLRAVGDDRLEERLGLVGICENRLAAMRVETVTALAARDGEAKAADAVRTRLRKSRSASKQDVKLAGQLADVPETAGALAAGSITPQHARMIAEAAEQAPGAAPIDEAELLAAAQVEPTDVFGRTVREHVNDRIGDDLEERRKHQRSQRRLSFKQQPDGMFEMVGRFDPLTGSRIETALGAAANRLWHAEDPQNRATPRQRMADALELLITGAGGGGANGKAAAQGVDLLVIADYDVVAGRLRDARLVDGTPLTPEELLRLACDANILPALFDRKGEPLWLGRGKRHASAYQRAVLAERDKGCVGCGVSANWCQAHHIVHWEHGGTTDIDNLCLLCSHCHHYEVHTNGAEIVRGPDGRFALQRPGRPPPGQKRRTSTTAAAGATVDFPRRC